MSIRAYIGRWLLKDSLLLAPANGANEVLRSDAQLDSVSFRYAVLRATNGVIIEQSRFKRNPVGPDWTHKLRIVKDGEDLADVIRSLVVAESLEP
jgi:hypothetical protein